MNHKDDFKEILRHQGRRRPIRKVSLIDRIVGSNPIVAVLIVVVIVFTASIVFLITR